ncbi:MAG: PH domain-containing protein, partial [Shewanella sp.]
MGLLDGLLGNASEVDLQALAEELGPIMGIQEELTL